MGSTFKYLFTGKPVSGCILIAASYAAVITVVFAVIGELDKTSYKDLVAIVFSCNRGSFLSQIRLYFSVTVFEK